MYLNTIKKEKIHCGFCPGFWKLSDNAGLLKTVETLWWHVASPNPVLLGSSNFAFVPMGDNMSIPASLWWPLLVLSWFWMYSRFSFPEIHCCITLSLPNQILFFLSPPPALLRYNWHTTLCKFKVYNVMVWYTHILQNVYHNKVS